MSAENPPAFEQPGPVVLDSVKDSKITNVSIYSGRAEVTRLFKFTARVGQNAVHIQGLPTVLDQDSLRVEGRGSATIHDVTVSSMTSNPGAHSVTSEVLVELITSKERTEKALERCKKSVASLESFLTSINIQHVNSANLGAVMEHYDSVGEKLDNKMSKLEANLKTISEQIDTERSRLGGPVADEKRRCQASVRVFAEREAEVQIALIYAVSNANWSAAYDIRVNMDVADKPVTLIYKAAIHQNSGESWEDVPLYLETASPTYGVRLPILQPWTVSLAKWPSAQPPPPGAVLPLASRGRAKRFSASPDDLPSFSDYMPQSMTHQMMTVHSQGNVNATFHIPGLNSVPSDGSVHNFTIVQMSLEANMTWISVPKQDARTHLNAKIKNVSEFTLLYGPSSVYVDGSFVSRSIVPAVSPQESFDCPLGLDPSVRIVYHPRSKLLSQSGFYSKSSNYIYTQRISIHNTKTKPVDRLKLIDHIPVSEDAQCIVKLISPPIPSFRPSTQTSSTKIAEKSAIQISEGVVAQWDGADEPGVDPEALGKDGKLNWICSVAPQDKINLTLQWEVTVPLKASVTGL